MNDKILDILSLNLCQKFEKDQKGDLILPGDILIRTNKELEFAKNKLNSISLDNLDSFIKNLPFQTSLYSITDDIAVAEYVNIDILEKKNPILGLHGYVKSMGFNFDYLYNSNCLYRHLTNDEIENYNIGLISSNEYSAKKETNEVLIKRLMSKFSGKANILKIIKAEQKDYVIFLYRIKDSIAYKKAKKFQRGVFERLNWYKNSNSILFPWLHFYFKDKSIFDMAINNEYLKKHYFPNGNQQMFEKWIQIMYYFERNEEQINHKYFSIFCIKYENSNKRIFFYKRR